MAYPENESDSNIEWTDPNLEKELYARHVEVNTYKDLEQQRGTPIPALFNQFYKFIQNPSTVSVETFKRMVDTDDTIGSGVDFLTTALASRLGQYQHPSQEVTNWVNARLDEIDGGWFAAIKELLSATWVGFSVAEKVWANTPNGFALKKIVTLPPTTMLFETDRLGEITDDGILQYQRNYNPGLSGGANYLFGFASITGIDVAKTRPDTFAKLGDFPFPLRIANTYSYLSIRIPKMKCVHYAFDAQGKFGNPYGRSLLRRCYKYYVMKDAFLQMLSIALDRKGTPLSVVFCDPNLTVIDETKYTSAAGARGNSNVGMRADLAAKRAFQNIHNDTTIFLPGKKGQNYDIEMMPQSSNHDSFIASIDLCNKSIMRALLLPSLIFTGGDGSGAYSLGQEHARTFDKICDGINSGLEQTLLQQVIYEMLCYNFPRSAWEKDGLGSFAKRQLTNDEIQKEMEVVEKGVAIGAIDMNDIKDLNSIREKLNLEPRMAPIEKPDPFGLQGEDDGQLHGTDGQEDAGNLGSHSPGEAGFPDTGRRGSTGGSSWPQES